MTDQQSSDSLNIIERIYKKLPYLNPALHRVGEFILENPEDCKTMTIKQLANACEVAESTVTRFVKELDLSGYQDLKLAIAESLFAANGSESRPEEKYVYEGISRTDSIGAIVEKVVFRNMQTLSDTKQRLSAAELERAVQLIQDANLLVFCCMGSSGVAAEEAVMRFTRAGKKCVLFRDHGIQLISAAIAHPSDVVIGISNSGRTMPVVGALKLAQGNGVKTIAITSFEDAPLVKHSDVTLFTPTKSPPPGLDLYGESTTSVSAQILVIDILYTAFAARNFDQTLDFLEQTYAAAIKDSRVD